MEKVAKKFVYFFLQVLNLCGKLSMKAQGTFSHSYIILQLMLEQVTVVLVGKKP